MNIPLTTFYDSCRKIGVYGLVELLVLNNQIFGWGFRIKLLDALGYPWQVTESSGATYWPIGTTRHHNRRLPFGRHHFTTTVVKCNHSLSQSARVSSSRGCNLIGSSFVFKNSKEISTTHQDVGMGCLVVARHVVWLFWPFSWVRAVGDRWTQKQ